MTKKTPTAAEETRLIFQSVTASSITVSNATTVPEVLEETTLVVTFTSRNGTGTVVISGGGSPVVAWFSGLPGEVSLDLVDADVGDAVSVVEELVEFSGSSKMMIAAMCRRVFMCRLAV